MTITFQIPADVEQQLRAQGGGDLDSEAKEAMFVEFYRQDRLSHHQLSRALGLSRFETDAILKKHHVMEDLPTREELEGDLLAARRLVQR
jgi:predicted HTH domain antitoxin